MTALCVMTAVVVPSLAIHPLDRFENNDAGLDVERAGRLIAKENVRPLRDGACNRDALLLTTRHLRREMIHAIAQPNKRERFFRLHRMRRDLGDERDVLARGQTRDQIVELKDEPDMLTAVTGKRGVVKRGQIMIAKTDAAAGRHIKPAENIEQCDLPLPTGPAALRIRLRTDRD